ncbi:mucin-15 [Scomber scombrus]|uniref:Mucin-15 n=1 Tax=Scomber scombrus TaxID=13677 RepID=A0AAV1PUE0_SCOSC
MGQHLKITVVLLLLVQAFHLAALQDSTDSPGRTIDKSWLRDVAKKTVEHQNAAADEVTQDEQGTDYSSGVASGSMVIENEIEENETSLGKSASETSNDLTAVKPTQPPAFPNATTKRPELTNASATTDSSNSSQTNMTETEEEFNNATTPQNSTTEPMSQNSTIHPIPQNSTIHPIPQNSTVHPIPQNSTIHPIPQNSTIHPIPQNSTGAPDFSNRTDLQTTSSAPETNATQELTTKSNEDRGLINITTIVTTTAPHINKTSTMSSATTTSPSETAETIPKTTTTPAPNTPEKANLTDKNAASGGSSERGLASDTHKSKRHGAWGAVLGTAVAVAFVGLVAYVILKKKHQKGFTHRKLVEEFPSDPVLTLDNSEPLDLNYGGSAYYNPALQGDDIQMTNFPGRHRN